MIDAETYELFILVLITTLSLCAAMKLSAIKTPDAYGTHGFGFSQAVVFNNVIYSSGQVGRNKDYTLKPNPDFSHQLEQTLKNIEHLLESWKCSWQDVLHHRVYIIDMYDAKRDSIGSFIQQTFLNGYAPATTIPGISALARQNLLIKIEFIAKIKYS